MSEPTPETTKDDFEKFFDMVKKLAWLKAQGPELKIPEVMLVDKDKKLTIAVLMVNKPLWRPMTYGLVKKTNAEAYAVLTEMWVSHDRELRKLGLQPRDDPNAESVMCVFAYSKDGREKSDYVYITKDRKLQLEKRPIQPEDMLLMVIGNVFDLDKQQRKEEKFMKATRDIEGGESS
jgi:hypothetical protein